MPGSGCLGELVHEKGVDAKAVQQWRIGMGEHGRDGARDKQWCGMRMGG